MFRNFSSFVLWATVWQHWPWDIWNVDFEISASESAVTLRIRIMVTIQEKAHVHYGMWNSNPCNFSTEFLMCSCIEHMHLLQKSSHDGTNNLKNRLCWNKKFTQQTKNSQQNRGTNTLVLFTKPKIVCRVVKFAAWNPKHYCSKYSSQTLILTYI